MTNPKLWNIKVSVSYPGRALIHVFNNPYATKGYLSWGCLSKKLAFLHLIITYKSKFFILDDLVCIYKVASELLSSTLCSLYFYV